MEAIAADLRIRAYDKDAVDLVLAALADEEARLQSALASTRERIVAARAALAEASSLRERIGDLVLAADQRLQELDAETALAVAHVLAAADLEVDEVLAQARAVAAGTALGAVEAVEVPDVDGVVIDLAEHRAVEVG